MKQAYIPNPGDAVEYIDPDSGWHHAGTVLAVDTGNGWNEPKVRVQWQDIDPTWIRASALQELA